MKRVIKGLCVLTICISVIGCAAAKKEENNNEDTTLITGDKTYSATLQLSQKAVAGKFDKNANIEDIVYDIQLSDHYCTTRGVLSISDDMNSQEEDITNNGIHKFKINDKTLYQGLDGGEVMVSFTKKEFKNQLLQRKDEGMGLIIEMENGVAKSVSLTC